ncbi:MAG: carboxypeptidase regulatory-like domain-containing protein [Roseivirga sp.]
MQFRIRIIAILLLVAAGLSAQGTSSLLEKKLSLKVQEQRVDAVLKRLEKEGDFTIAYSNGSFDASRKVSINATDESLQAILNQIFPDGTVKFRELSGKLLIYKSGDTIKVPGEALYQTVRGRVLDEVSNQPIPGANVIIPGSDPLIGASTDPDGRFRIERVPVGRHNFQITFLGYLPKLLPGLAVDAGKEIVLEIMLAESVTELESVVVTAELDKARPINEMAMVSAKSFSVEETSRYAGSFNDPARMATSYAGVVGSQDDTENSIIVRGNSPRGLLWRLEGLEIPNPNHFASDGSSNGAISMLNSNVMTNSDFLTGAFPAEYGNAFSGVFDMKMRNGNNEKREYAIQAGLLGLDASLEGPFKRKEGKNLANASYLINYRYSTITMLEALGLDIAGEGGQVPAFQDLAFKFNIPTVRAGTFSLYGLGGVSDSNDDYTIDRNDRTFNLDEKEEYRMGLAGLSHVINMGKHSFLETGLSYSRYDYEYLFENLFDDEIFVEDTEQYSNTNIRLSSTLNTKFSARHSTKFGIIYTLNRYELDSRGFFENREPSYASNEKGDFGMYQAFVSHQFRLSNELTLTGGFHYLRMDLAGQDNLEPRFGLRWQFKPGQALSFGFGMHSRKEETSLYFTEVLNETNPENRTNKNLDLAKARHFVVGYDNRLGNNLNLKLEAYYQDLYDIPIAAISGSDYSSLNQNDAFQRFYLINEGTGENYGIELTLEKFLSQGYFFLLTGTLYESNYKTLTGVKYNTRYNGRYNFNMVGGREIQLGTASKKKTLNIGMEAVFGGGARVREIDLTSSIAEGRTIFAADTPFARQLKDYMRLDFQVALKTNKKVLPMS